MLPTFMAARRRTRRKTKSRRKKQGVSLIGLAETYMLLNVASQTVMNNDLASFVMGKDGGGSSSFKLNIKEILGGGTAGVYGPTAANAGIAQSALGVMGHNLKKNWVTGAWQMILIPIGFKVGKSLARPALSRTNRLLNKTGIGSTVKL